MFLFVRNQDILYLDGFRVEWLVVMFTNRLSVYVLFNNFFFFFFFFSLSFL
jgi:hypothetical protein